MTNFWKSANYVVLIIQIAICSLGTFYKHIAFGAGLGDIMYYGLIYLLLLAQIVSTIVLLKKKQTSFMTLTLIFFATTVLVVLKATIWRGVEYPWNGHFFYR